MANGTSTNLLQGLAVANQKWQSAEIRPASTSVLAAAYAAEKANPMLAELRTREDRPTSIDFINSMAEQSLSQRTADHTGPSGDTNRVAVSCQSFVETFSISLTQFDNNTIAWVNAYQTFLTSKINNILKRADVWFLAQLVADITEINVSSLGTLDPTTHVMTIPEEQKDYYVQNIYQAMMDNEYSGRIGMIGDSKASVAAKQKYWQGEGNNSNLGWQFDDLDVTFMSTSREIFTGAHQSVLAFPFEQIGVIPWIPKKNRKDVDIDLAWNGKNGDFARIMVPILDKEGNVAYEIPIAISHYTNRADASGVNGSVQDILMQVEVSLDLAMSNAPLSDKRGANDTVIYGFDLETV